MTTATSTYAADRDAPSGAASGAASEPVLRVENVWKRYDKRVAVSDLSFEVRPGQTLGLLGPNGAGKTTTLRMIVNILRPDEGRISILGRLTGEETKKHLGYLPEERGLYKKMKVGRLLEFFGRIHGLDPATAKKRGVHWLERVGMGDRVNDAVNTLSKGLQQKVQFAATMVHEPKLIILDEVFSGLDPVNAKMIRDLLRDLRKEGMAIIFSTHVLEQAEQLCDHVVMLKDGKARIQGATADVKREHGSDWHVVAPADQSKLAALRECPQFAQVEAMATKLRVRFRSDASPREFLAWTLEQRIDLDHFERVQASLTDIFIERIGELKPSGEMEAPSLTDS
jgi:ABC-2 type transport system ATP-binding protein